MDAEVAIEVGPKLPLFNAMGGSVDVKMSKEWFDGKSQIETQCFVNFFLDWSGWKCSALEYR